ncbi:MAG TPA: 3-deoxy-7-phosphoheptulonate synthase [Armatimonadota bacterium]|jgi:3-deoxy-7-phosphoheptulonate synthase
MVIILKPGVDPQIVEDLIAKVKEMGFTPHPIVGVVNTVIAVIGDRTPEAMESLEALPGVDRVVPILRPYKLAGREVKPESTVITLPEGSEIGGRAVTVIAGPCAVESREQFLETAAYVKQSGAKVLRGFLYKARTSPHDFQGLHEAGLDLLREARELLGMPIITEVMDTRDVEKLHEVADIFQIGARNMQNYSLLAEVGLSDRPVLLKRGMSATVDDLLKAAEYVLVGGNQNVMLCERGIRTFETSTRNTLDISAIPVLKRYTHLPVLVDPSHSGGHDWLVPALSKAAVAAGADGLVIETHRDPAHALVDGPQALGPDAFQELMDQLPAFAYAAGRTM